MPGSAKPTWSNARTIPKCFTTSHALADILTSVGTATGASNGSGSLLRLEDARRLAQGGFNDVWLITVGAENNEHTTSFILREPTKDSLLPWQLENEVAWLTYITKNHPVIPVPKVYAYQSKDPPFIAMEYIAGQPLNEAWNAFTDTQKSEAVQEIADVVIALGEIRFDTIGGLSPDHKPAPTVESTKLFKGRHKFHSHDFYDIGPYPSTRDYVLACYDKEIYYYSHASADDMDWTWFVSEDEGTEAVSDKAAAALKKTAFVQELEQERRRLQSNPHLFAPEQPFVLCHGDFQARNIMMHDGHIKAILDWEFAGSFPLSELWDGMFDVLEAEDDAADDENSAWFKRVEGFVVDRARVKGWTEADIQLLIKPSNNILQSARVEMVPRPTEEQELDDSVEQTFWHCVLMRLGYIRRKIFGA